MNTLEQERLDFIRKSGRFLSFPLAGSIVWGLVGIISLFLPERISLFVLLFGTGAIFPLALLFSRFTGQVVFLKDNRFGKLAGLCVLMVNLLWALHITLVVAAPEVVPLSIAISLGLHWIVYSWIVEASFGIVHAILRTVLCTASFFLFPETRLFAISISVVICYLISCWQLVALFRQNKWDHQARA